MKKQESTNKKSVFPIITVLFCLSVIIVMIHRGDKAFALTVEECRACHGSNVSDRHHLLLPVDPNLLCTDCHMIIKFPGGIDIPAYRDCLLCHPSTIHTGVHH